MTETEWLACSDPAEALDYLEDRVSERKLRLFACAYCRRLWKFLGDRHLKGIIRVSEGYTDSDKNEALLRAAWRGNFARGVVGGGREAHSMVWPYRSVVRRVYTAAQGHKDRSAIAGELLRCVFGSLPFRPVSVDPVWRNPLVEAIAHGIYERRRFEALPILADALEEAGCTNEELLNHCQSTGPHARGCWPVDLLLGRS